MKNKRNIIIGAIVAVILLMAVGYSALATQLSINGTAEITGEWDVRITNIETKEISDGCDDGEPEFTNTTAKFDAKLGKPGDAITYEITIENQGTIDAKLDHILFLADEENGSEAIKYSSTNIAETLGAGEQTKLDITIEYDQETAEVPQVKTKSLTGVVEYVQK